MKKVLEFYPDKNEIKIRDMIYTYDDIHQLYIIENNSLKDLQILFDLGESSVLKIIKFFDFHKDKQSSYQNLEKSLLKKYGVKNISELSEVSKKRAALRKGKPGKKNIHDKYPGKAFDEYYQNHSQKESAEYFNVSISAVQNWIKKYNITKIVVKVNKPEKIKKTKEELRLIRKQAYEKTCQTNMERYGVISTLLLPEVQSKIKQSVFEHYGCSNPMKSDIVKNRMKENNKKKYGVGLFHQKDINDYENWENDEKFIQYVSSNKNTLINLSEHFNVSYSAVEKRISRLNLKNEILFLNGSSTAEEEILQMLIQLGINETDIIRHDRSVLEGQEIDYYIPKYSLGIEFNGSYWHSELQDRFQDHNGRSLYHQEKSLKAQNANVFLFHIFEYEWNNLVIREQIKNRLSAIFKLNYQIIGARKCKIIELNKNQKKDFLNSNHIQGNDQCNVALGLIFENQIVACMTFRKSRYKKYTYELSRFCCKNYYSIPGAANRLFKNYIKNYCKEGDSIVSYNDITKTKGNLYQVLGFEMVSINAPNYVWMNFQTGDIKTRYQTQFSNEISRMHDQKYYRICDCGTKTWVYKVNGGER